MSYICRLGLLTCLFQCGGPDSSLSLVKVGNGALVDIIDFFFCPIHNQKKKKIAFTIAFLLLKILCNLHTTLPMKVSQGQI